MSIVKALSAASGKVRVSAGREPRHSTARASGGPLASAREFA